MLESDLAKAEPTQDTCLPCQIGTSHLTNESGPPLVKHLLATHSKSGESSFFTMERWLSQMWSRSSSLEVFPRLTMYIAAHYSMFAESGSKNVAIMVLGRTFAHREPSTNGCKRKTLHFGGNPSGIRLCS
jgi:hypothetical protein